jgi:hypothetical protein
VTNGFFFFFFNFVKHTGHDPQEEITKFGYRSEEKVVNF